MNKESKIYVAGHRGLVGSAIVKRLQEKGYSNIVTRTRGELDLTDQVATADFFKLEQPEYVFQAAAKVGGIMANSIYRADFIYENLQIQNNIIHNAWKNGVKKLLFLGSSCIYPKNCPQPMREEHLLTDALEYTNEPYAIAKIAGMKMCESYNLQYGTNYISVMPTNLYGPNDNYDLERSHVLPALIRKMHLGHALEQNAWDVIADDLNLHPVEGVNGSNSQEEIVTVLAKYGISKNEQGEVSVDLWGTGTPRREFLHSEDMADACVYIMEAIDFESVIKQRDLKEVRNTHINIGTGEDLEIKELALLVKQIVGFNGVLNWDSSKPDGTMKKLLDVTRLHALGWKHEINLKEGIHEVYQRYKNE